MASGGDDSVMAVEHYWLPLPPALPITPEALDAAAASTFTVTLRPVLPRWTPTVWASARLVTPPFVVDVSSEDNIGAADVDAYPNGGFGAVPAADEAVASLPKTMVGDCRQASGDADECAVCLQGYETGQALPTMPGYYEFHEGCIVDWLRVSRVCPFCRFKLSPKAEDGEPHTEEDDEDPSTG